MRNGIRRVRLEGIPYGLGVTDIRLDEAQKAGVIAGAIEVPLLHRPRIERVEGVEHGDLVPPGEKRVDEMRTDEARATRDEDAHPVTRPGATFAF